MTTENVRILPFQVRPRAGEGIRSFIVRLAHANHLPPRYLRTYLCEPPEHLGLPSWTRLAAATGRAPETLVATLETRRCLECDGEIPPSDVIGRQALRCSQACREKAYRKRLPRARSRRPPAESAARA
ncbi:TniQ family protein [Streptomyces sp. LaPpAH-108]|uniref:TniQ family protein n=1 Tax=Streptomyces sp. LaPpAH-108 TaxID=1155714 RepID=UPI0003A0268C